MHKALFIAPYLLSAILACQAQPAAGQWKLSGDQQPTEPYLWQRPATVSYSRQDGKATAVIDADLRYAYRTDPSPASVGWKLNSYSAGVYVHRNTDDSAPKNDRGVSLRVGKTYRFGEGNPTDEDAATRVRRIDFLNLSMSAKFGKTLVTVKDTAGGITGSYDKVASRLIGQADYYWIPRLGDRPRAPWIQINLAAGAYHDRVSGSGVASGNLSGALVKARLDWALLGLDPKAIPVGSELGFLPSVYAAAQLEKDLAGSGNRREARYELYAVGLNLSFARLGEAGLVPSLTLERSTGADLLTGRAETGKTTLAFGLAF